MAETIDYYFSAISPWAYIGHDALHDMAERRGVTIAYRPVALGRVFEAGGSLPLAKRHPTRQRLRWLELQRWRDKRGIELNLQPAHWPFDPALADRTIIAALRDGHDPAPLTRAIFAAVWAGDRDMADEAALAETVAAVGLPADQLIADAKSDEVAAVYDDNTEAAIAGSVFGSPSYVRDGELFWGQDRIDLLEEAIASGRAGYRPL